MSSDSPKVDLVPRDAATTILLRPRKEPDAHGDTFEVLLVKRTDRADFMGGAHVFPGGKVDALDEGFDLDWTGAGRIEATPGRSMTGSAARALFVAAARELFEEAGVLLARTPGGGAIQGELFEALLEQRDAVHAGETTFSELLARLDVSLDHSGLTYFAHWITPSMERRRFDTRFFIAQMPEGQHAQIDASETTELAWWTPQGACSKSETEEIVLAPPTLRILEELRGKGTAQAAIESAQSSTIAAILPKVAATGDGIAVLLPWDADYAETEGEQLEGLEPHPNQEQISRVVLEGSHWTSAQSTSSGS